MNAGKKAFSYRLSAVSKNNKGLSAYYADWHRLETNEKETDMWQWTAIGCQAGGVQSAGWVAGGMMGGRGPRRKRAGRT